MNAKQFEKSLDLTIIAEDKDGITRQSLELAPAALKEFGYGAGCEPIAVYLLYQEEPWEFLTYVVGLMSFRAIKFTGFAWGYGGEGPRGLHKLITQYLDWPAPAEDDMPEAHKPGLWRIMKDAKVEVTRIPFPLEEE